MAGSFELFEKLFRQEISQVQEFSFDESSENTGTCILGESDAFLKRFFQFAKTLPFFPPWESQILDAIHLSEPNDYGLKVDWKVKQACQFTLYFRNPKSLNFFSDIWPRPSPVAIAKLFHAKLPFCFGIRVGNSSSISYSGYLQTKLSPGSFRMSIPKLLRKLQWPEHLKDMIISDVLQVSPHRYHGCIGTEASHQVLKLDLTGVGLGRVLDLLRRKGVSELRIHELIGAARKLNQIRTNYFALKYGPNGFLGWKVYFAVIGSSRNLELPY